MVRLRKRRISLSKSEECEQHLSDKQKLTEAGTYD